MMNTKKNKRVLTRKDRATRWICSLMLLCMLTTVLSACGAGRYESDTLDDLAAILIDYPEVEGNYHIGDPMNRMPVYKAPTSQITLYTDGYYKASSGEAGMFDIARPAVNIGTAKPFVLFVPGGSWMTANKDSMKQQILTLSHHGYVAAGISTRTLPKFDYNAQMADVMDAAQYFYDNAVTYDIDVSKMYICGLSSGGNLVLNAAYSRGVGFLPEEKIASYTFSFQAVAAVAPPVSDIPLTDTIIAANMKLITELLGPNPEISRISPIRYINYDTPPTIVFTAQQDPVIPEDQAKVLRDSLREWDINVQWVSYTDATHVNWPLERLLKDMCDFFESVL